MITGDGMMRRRAERDRDRMGRAVIRKRDVRRVAQRGLRIVESRPIELVALVFDVSRTAPASDTMRRNRSGAVHALDHARTRRARHRQV